MKRGIATALSILLLAMLLIGSGYLMRGATEKASASQIDRIELTQLVRKVKTDLAEAERLAIVSNEPSLFTLKDFDLDIKVVASGTTATGFKIYTVGSDVTIGQEKVQTIHLHWIADPQSHELIPRSAKSRRTPNVVIPPDS